MNSSISNISAYTIWSVNNDLGNLDVLNFDISGPLGISQHAAPALQPAALDATFSPIPEHQSEVAFTSAKNSLAVGWQTALSVGVPSVQTAADQHSVAASGTAGAADRGSSLHAMQPDERFIDHIPHDDHDEFVTTGGRWTDAGGTSSGSFTNILGGSGGVVAWSLAGAGLFDVSGSGTYSGASVNLGSFLPFDFQAVLRTAFDAWAAVANIEFIQVQDGGGNFGGGAFPTIRVVGGATLPVGNNLAWAFFPTTHVAGGDMVFDSAETSWTAANFLHVAMHEIGHALGLNHQNSPPTAIMNPSVNMSNPLSTLQADDIAGMRAVYGAQDFGANSYYMPAAQANLTLLDAAPSLTIVGNAMANTINGTAADETYRGNGGNDTINGGLGTDSAVFSGLRSAYTITNLGGGSVRVTGPDGTDTLTNVERLVFNDQVVNVTKGFDSPTFELANFGPGAGGWSSDDLYKRELADVNGDGRDDIVGFGNTGVFVSLATSDGHFAFPTFELASFGSGAGGWSSDDLYKRELADVNGDGKADIVGFGNTGVFVSLATSNGHFAFPTFELASFGSGAGGWSSDDLYKRELADVEMGRRTSSASVIQASTYLTPSFSCRALTDV